MNESSTPHALERYLQELAGDARAGQLLEVRWAQPHGPMRRRFIPARSTRGAQRLILAHSADADVYIGVALRERRSGARGAIAGSRFVFVECDRVPEQRVLDRLPPTIAIASGTPSHRHLYWRLHDCADRGRVEHANVRLAHALGGDLRCVDLARILRPPGTLNHKSEPPRAVRLLSVREDARYSIAQLLAALPPLPDLPGAAQRTPSPPVARRTELDLRLRAIPARDYVLALTGREPDRSGKILCPFHSERRASLQLYPDGSFYCFGCGRGGSVIDFAAALWGSGTRGGEFLALRARLACRLGLLARG